MHKEQLLDLLGLLQTYVENDNIETISSVTHKKHEEWKELKLADIRSAVGQLESSKPVVPEGTVSGAMTDERKLFEDEMRRYGYMEFDLRKGVAGAYIGGNAQIAWHFWKARSLLSASGQAVSEKAELETKLAFLEGHIKRVRNVLRCPDDVNTVEHAVDIMKSTPAQQTEEPVNVSRADLQKLRDSIHGLCYLGEEAEKELIDSLLAAAPAPVVAKLPQPVQTEAQQSEKDAQDAKRYRYITEVAGMRFKPAGRLCLDTLEDTNAAIDDAIAKEKAK